MSDTKRLQAGADIAKAIHYPECWDTAAYPTVESALAEVYAAFKCSECAANAQAAPKTGIEVVLVKDRVYGSMHIRQWRAIGQLSDGKHTFYAAPADGAKHG